MRRLVLAGPILLAAAVASAAEPPGPRAELGRLAREAEALRGFELAQLAGEGGLAAYEGRLERVEEDLRRLTGRLEELEFAQQRALQRVDELARELQARAAAPPPDTLAAREPDARDVAATDPVAPDVPSPPPAPAAPARLPGGLAPPEGVLGRVPEGAVRNLPPPRAVRGTPGQADGSAYEAALAQMQSGQFVEAEGSFEAFLAANPEDRRASSAAYWLAESQFARKDYQSAAASFARNYRSYGPEAPRAPDNLLKLGMALAAVGDTAKACQTYDALEARHPGAPTSVKQALSRERAAADCS